MSDTYDSTDDTRSHIARVAALLAMVADDLHQRGEAHDRSKLEEPEKSAFDRATPKLKTLTYGSVDYQLSLADLGEALQHHYAHNSHHPEHYEDGIRGMNLLDVIEMFLDWKAASERHGDGGIIDSIEKNEARFGFDYDLECIFKNTARYFGWVVESAPSKLDDDARRASGNLLKVLGEQRLSLPIEGRSTVDIHSSSRETR